MLIHNINFTSHRKSACYLQLLVFQEINHCSVLALEDPGFSQGLLPL